MAELQWKPMLLIQPRPISSCRGEALPPLGGIDIQDSHLASDGTVEGLVHFVFTRHLLLRLGTVHECFPDALVE